MDIMSAEDLKKMNEEINNEEINNEEINKEIPLSGEEQGSLETPQSQPVTAVQEAPQDPRSRVKKKKVWERSGSLYWGWLRALCSCS